MTLTAEAHHPDAVSSGRSLSDKGPEGASRPPRLGVRCAVVMAVGGLITGSLAAALLAGGARGDDGYRLEPVGRAEIAMASQSLLPAEAAALVAGAEACRAPLAVLTVRNTAAARGTLRIRSGSYATPNLLLGSLPDRVAMPFPAPYRTGRGQITIESVAEGVDVFLTPGIHIAAGKRTSVIDVRWDPETPC